jgi:heme-degrading monooxygenase HmoA
MNSLQRASPEPRDVIARFWSARTTPALSSAYLEHFSQHVQPELQRLHGFLGFTVCTRPVPGEIEILVTTFWNSFSAIEAFAGTDRESAVVAAEAAALLTEYDRRVRHYEVAVSSFASSGATPVA